MNKIKRKNQILFSICVIGWVLGILATLLYIYSYKLGLMLSIIAAIFFIATVILGSKYLKDLCKYEEEDEDDGSFLYASVNKHHEFTIEQSSNGYKPLIQKYVHDIPDDLIMHPYGYYCKSLEEAQSHIVKAIEVSEELDAAEKSKTIINYKP